MHEKLTNSRDNSFDMVKGICIVLMIAGHCFLPETPHKIIFSFHMPVFFIIAGFFARKKTLVSFVITSCKRLLIPYSVVYFFCLAVGNVLYDVLMDSTYFYSILNVKEPLFSVSMLKGGILPVWFLFALFWCRIIFVLILRIRKDVYKIIICLIIPLISINLYVYGKWPFSLLAGFAAIGFYGMGYFVNKNGFLKNEQIWRMVPLGLLCWFVCLFPSTKFLDMIHNSYNGYYVLDCLGALSIFFILYIVVSKSKSNNIMWSFLNWCGKNSLIILCVHSVEFNFIDFLSIKTLIRGMFSWYAIYIVVILRVIFDVTLTYLIARSRLIKKYIFMQE